MHPTFSDNRFRVRASKARELCSTDRSQKAHTFGETALKVIRSQVLYDVYGFYLSTDNRTTSKGINLEQTGVELVNDLFFLDGVKNTERKTDDHFTGECDILLDDCIRDIKCSWSLESFPLNDKEVQKLTKNRGYDYQAQVYMHLYDRDICHIDYVLLPTPIEMCKNEQEITMLHHLVRQMPQEKRIRTIAIERNRTLIEKLKERVEMAQEHYLDLLKSL